jgi:ADP-heptose:LPS heptosyltransferase
MSASKLRIPSNKLSNAALRVCAKIISLFPGGRRCKEPRNILVTRLGNVGDIIVALPAFHALRRLYPNAKITLLTSPTNRGAPGAVEVLKNDKTFDDMIVYYVDESSKPDFLRNLIKRIRALDVDLAIALPNQLTSFDHLFKNLCMFAAAGVRRMEGFQCVTPPDYRIRQVDRLMRIINEIGSAEVESFPWMQPSAADAAIADELLAPAQRRPVAVMHCGAKRPANCWAPESFVEVGKRLIAERGAAVVLTGGPGEAELTARVAAGIGAGCIDLAGKTDLGVLAAIAQKCAVVISNDTGIMHIAYAAGAPVVGIFSGRYFPEIWYPYGDRHAILRRPIECQYCGYETCALYPYPKCLELITPDDVFQAAVKFLP